MVTAASGHRVIAEHHQGKEVGHLQRPSWPPPQFHPEKEIQGREEHRRSKGEREGGRGHEKTLEPQPQKQTGGNFFFKKGQTNNIAFWTSRNNVRGEPAEVKFKKKKTSSRTEKTWGKSSSSTNTHTVGKANTSAGPLCYQQTFTLLRITLGLTLPIFIGQQSIMKKIHLWVMTG